MSDNDIFNKKHYGDIFDDLWGGATGSGKLPSAPTTTSKVPSATSDPVNISDPVAGINYIHDLIGDLQKNLQEDTNLFAPHGNQSAQDQSKTGTETQKSEQSPAAADTSVPEPDESDPMEDLNALVGLEDLKKDVQELISLVKMQKMRSEQGLKSIPVSLHLVFSGNPGTGKTTVARILARLYRNIGVLSKGQLVEVDRSALVAGFVGQTATKTQEKIKEAMGGILFIDEAYTLNKKEGNDFGQEAIDTLLKAMEDHRDDLIVIVAGYTELMEDFVNSNPGLKSRFNKYLFFKDYTAEELISIFRGFCTKYQYTLDEKAEAAVKSTIETMEKEKTENFANAREVRNLFEKIITRQALRISKCPEGEEKPDITVLLEEDITGEEPKSDVSDSDSAVPAKENADTTADALTGKNADDATATAAFSENQTTDGDTK